MTSRDTSIGIAIYRASRLEALLDPLIVLLDSNPPNAVLAPQTVIAAHPGMRQWLLGALARKRGNAGIVANLDIVLPSAWLDRLAQATLGEAAFTPRAYRREFLRWQINASLDALDDPRIHAYLHGADAERRRFQLSDRLARIYSQYLVYRPDWLEAWAAGRSPIRDSGFLGPLWQSLRQSIGQPHRGERLARLLALLDRTHASGDGTPLHIFGISHLAPTELAVLRAVAKQRLVVFYVPDPCREFWAGMTTERARLRELVQRAPDATTTESEFLQLDHPLLASWGRIGQHFLLLLDNGLLDNGEVAIDERHYLDKPEASIDPANRLEWLQESIRRAQPDLAPPHYDATEARTDASLRVHACHTRLRELEVLRDALLFELKRHPRLKPSDIVVMAPDIQAYAPLLPAVFGETGRHQGPLPYHLADLAIARAHPLFDAFARLLDLPRSRMTAPEVVDLLALAPVANRFGLADPDIDTISRWLRDARVAWALDPSFRARFDVPPISEQTFSWGMDRMLAGYTMGANGGEAPQVARLPDGIDILPLDGISGPQAAILGTFDEFLVEIARWFDFSDGMHRASTWSRQLEDRMVAMFRIDTDDRTARDAWDALLETIRALASEPAQAGLNPPLPFAVVREWLRERLAAVSERQRFLMGGVTFCGMVPQRAIPFGIVAVLGLDDGVFPRPDNDPGIDPMFVHRRLGDRDVRSDDRWLFLQSLMSARSALHLSYIGGGVRDGKPRNPAAPLAELLTLLDRSAGLSAEEKDIVETEANGTKSTINRRPWLVRHPLQPFDARYFDGVDPALFSFRGEFAQIDTSNAIEAASNPTARTYQPIAVAEASAGERIAPLHEVMAYFRNPAKDFLNRRVKLRLDALDDDSLRDSESLEASFERIDRVGRRVFFDAIASPLREISTQPPEWLLLSGLLPPGRPGEDAWNTEAESVAKLLASAKAHPLFACGMPERIVLALQKALGAYRIEGALARAYRAEGTRWIFDVFPGKTEDALDFSRRIGLFLEWALLRLDDPQAESRAQLYVLCDGKEGQWQKAINVWDDGFVAATDARRPGLLTGLRARVVSLLDHWWTLQSDPHWYFAKTSWAAAKANPEGKTDPVAMTWDGFNGRGERNYSSGYERLLAGDALFERASDERARLDAIATALFEAISLGPAGERAA
jgi:exodeoxyribonuclease V gamma subunit